MNKPVPIAVTLEYDGANAPMVTAKGSGAIADQILAVARAHQIPVHEDRDLVEILSRIELDDEIPESLYRVVAEVIAFVYILKGKVPLRNRGMDRPNDGR